MNKVSNARIKELSRVTKVVDKKIGEDILRWFSHMEIMEKVRIAKRVYEGEHAGSCSVGKPKKRWIYTMKDCLKKKSFGCQASKENRA